MMKDSRNIPGLGFGTHHHLRGYGHAHVEAGDGYPYNEYVYSTQVLKMLCYYDSIRCSLAINRAVIFVTSL